MSIDVLSEKINAIHEKVTEINQQVKKTNGRVSKLELWQAYITGAVAALGGLTAIVGFLQLIT